jgi:hypothetical protein
VVLLSIIESGAIFIVNDIRNFVYYISHQLHINLTPTSLHFLKVISQKDRNPKQRRTIYDIFRFGMVLVAADCGSGDNRCPFQNQVYEMVEHAPTGKEE